MRKFYIISLIVIYLIGFMPVNFTVGAEAQVSEINKQNRIEKVDTLKQQMNDFNLNRQEKRVLDTTRKNIKPKVEVLKKEQFEKQSNNSEMQNKSLSLENGIKKNNKQEKLNYVPGEILIKFKKNKINLETISGRNAAENFNKTKSIEKKEDLRKNNISVFKIKDSKTVQQKIAELKNDPNIESVQPNFQYYPSSIDTNDTYKTNLWGLDNMGQLVNGISGAINADIDAPEAWEISEATSSASVIVAVIDSGVAYNHPDLVNNMWDGTNCVGEDKFGVSLNGGCNHGYDYEDNDKIPLPTDSSHGTHIAGIIAAVKNNDKGIIGVAPQAKIMALKSSLSTSDNIKSINFAQQNGAKVINASWGCYGSDQGGSNIVCGTPDYDDQAMIDAIESFSGLFITAAGNGKGDTDNDGDNHDSGQTLRFYPCDHTADNIICAAATDSNDDLADFSDYGITSVDISAPGVNIYSTVADTNIFNEDFEGDTYKVAVGGITQNNWGIGDDGYSKVIYSDNNNYPYESSAYTWLLQEEALDLSSSNISGATMSFTIWCDTPSSATFDDYIFTTYYSNGVWYDSTKYDEDKIYANGGSPWIDNGHLGYYKNYTENISNYLTNDFKFSFDWHTNSSVDYNWGCTIDDIEITKYSDGSDEQYSYMNGTSMAAPHVAGLAALIWSYKPELIYSEVKDAILFTGDSLSSLDGKTVSGKRINAFYALQSLSSDELAISGTVLYYDGAKPVPNADVILEDNQGTQLMTITTDENGYYEFTGLTSGDNYIVKVENDDNIASNGVSVSDLIKIRRHIVELETFSSIYKIIAADINNNNSVSVADLIKARRYIIELENPSVVWRFYSSSAVLTEENYLTEGLTRVYNNLTDNMNDQDYLGVKIGDVNNSWTND